MIAGDEQPDRRAVRHHPGVEGAEQLPPRRTQTLTAMPAPPPAQASHQAPAQRAITPETGIRIPADEAPVQGPPVASAELAQARFRIAQLERNARALAEARIVSYPPPIVPRPSPVPNSSSSPEAKVDRAIGGTMRLLLARYGWPALVALGIGGVALKPTADPAKADATLVIVEAMRADVALIREQLAGVLRREAGRDAYTRCLEETLDDVGSQLLPAQDRAGASQPIRAYVSRCQRLRP